MASIYKRGKKYWLKCDDGNRISLKTNDGKIAEKRARDIARAELVNADLPPDPIQVRGQETLAVAFENMVAASKTEATERFYKQKCRHLARILDGTRDVCSLTYEDVQSFINLRLKEKASRSTINKELVALRKTLKIASKRKALPYSIEDIFPEFEYTYVPKKTSLTSEEVDQLVQELEPHRRLWVILSCFTGANLSEVEKIERSDVRISRMEIHIRGTKRAKRDRMVPILPALRPWLDTAPKSGRLVDHWPNSRRDLQRACDRAGIPRVTSNDLRRTFASWLKQAGVDSLAVADLMGHSSTRMVESVYGRLSKETYRAAVSLLPTLQAP